VALLKFVALWVAVSLLLALALGRALRDLGGRALADEVEAYLRRMARPRATARRSGAVTSIITAGVLTLAAGAAAGRHLPPPSFVFGDTSDSESTTRTTVAPAGDGSSSSTGSWVFGAPSTTTSLAFLDDQGASTPTTQAEAEAEAGQPGRKVTERKEHATPNGQPERTDEAVEESTEVTTTTTIPTTTTTEGTPSGTTTTTEPPPPPEEPTGGN
jgi:hypothetical protein